MSAYHFFIFVVAAFYFCEAANSRTSSSALNDIKTLLSSGQENAAEISSYHFLRNYSAPQESVDVKLMLAEIYSRQARFDEMILWLKDLEKDKSVSSTQAPKVSYLLYKAYDKTGNKSAAEIYKSTLLRNFSSSEWAKKVGTP